MKIIPASYEILTQLDGEEILRTIERAGRVCYKSEDKITDGSAERLVRSIIERGHESVLEHVLLSVRFIVDRGVMAELTRHRLASFSVESSRYCNYSKGGFGGAITVIEPEALNLNANAYAHWECGCKCAEKAYFQMIAMGATPQEARSVLPNSLKTEVVMTCNLREWRHILRLRTDKTAHPQMREVMCPLLAELKERVPVVFGDIGRNENRSD